MSGLVFLWAVRRTMPELHHHTVFFSADYALEFHQLFDERRFPDDPTVYISASSRTDRSVVPGGDGETLFVMANAPADAEPWDEVATADARAKVVRRLERSGFSLRAGDLVAESVWTPRRLAEAYSMPGGAIYGAHSHGWRRAFHRAPNRTKVKGLYCVGGSAHPGGGTPTVVLSSKIVAGLMEKDFG
jgi:phytoene dehydrogenase-like protein